MTPAERIKAKILDLAIRGKLVPQDPNDEPASVLLERIKAEKAELVKAKKIKKDKNPSEIVVGADGATYEKFADGTAKDISDELPFGLPQGWAWARIDEVTSVVTDFVASGSFATLRENVKYYNEPNYAVLLRTKDLNTGLKSELVYTDKTGYDFLINSRLYGGELMLPNIGASIGRVFIVPKTNFRMTLAPNAIMVRCFEEATLQWLYYYFLSSLGQKALHHISSATAQGKFNKTDFRKLVICLPPLQEQKRIVVKIKELFAYANGIAEATDDIAKTAVRIDKKILDLAIRGQLVPQDSNDEPASELVKRIEAARKSKSGGKNTRSSASDKPAYEIDPPFDIPDSWEWVRLGEVLLPMTTKHPTGETFKYIDIDAIDNKTNVVLSPKHLPVEKAPSRACRGLQTGDTLFSVVRPYLRNIAYIADPLSDCIASTGFYVCRPSEAIEPMFLFKLLLSNYVVNGLNAFMKGDNSPSIRVEQLHDYPVPLPPLAEQKRIVSKIEELQTMTKSLTM